jgi:hypothetical protein
MGGGDLLGQALEVGGEGMGQGKRQPADAGCGGRKGPPRPQLLKLPRILEPSPTGVWRSEPGAARRAWLHPRGLPCGGNPSSSTGASA